MIQYLTKKYNKKPNNQTIPNTNKLCRQIQTNNIDKYLDNIKHNKLIVDVQLSYKTNQSQYLIHSLY